MFTKPFSEIEFDDIEAFCENWPEGVRAEYKRQLHKEIPKSVSSFANTSGGFLIFGVETNDKNEAILPIKGMPNERGIEERIVESAYTGIHPPVTPEVKVCDVPNKNGNVVVIVRVNESPEAPHAIQNDTKVHIRVGSTTQLATIDRIQYMLQRREEPEELSNRIISRIEERITDYWNLTKRPVPNLTLIARPIYPYRPLISPSEIFEYMRSQQSNSRSPILFNDADLDFGTRQVIGGVSFVGIPMYQELNEHGIIYLREKLQKSRYDGAFHVHADDNQKEYLDFRDLLRAIFQLIVVAKGFYQRCQYLGNVEITVKLREVRGDNLMFRDEFRYLRIQTQASLDAEIPASNTLFVRALMEWEKVDNIIVELVGQLLWGFSVRSGTWETEARDMLGKWRVNG